jgi:50S ribosomal protein L16 3-hydroxylase
MDIMHYNFVGCRQEGAGGFDSDARGAHGPAMKLIRFDSTTFLRDHWQKAPLLIRNPWADWRNPLEPDELAGLACEDGVESRLVIGAGNSLAVEHGPMAEARFATLSGQPWTLLVQAVDHHCPDVAALMEPFRFIPDWRIDDVMVSYATDGGGVGPHYDQYDVFLIQGLGRRRWRIGPRCDAQTPLEPHDDLRLIAPFDATSEWVLEPGDMLYVPPGFAHEGVALGDDCMTYSVGFRAPSCADLVQSWCQHQTDLLPDDARYTDADLAQQANPGEITALAQDRMHGLVLEALADRTAFSRWLGQYLSLPKYGEIDWRPDDPVATSTVEAALLAGTGLCRNPASRFAFTAKDEAVTLFVDGQAYDCKGDLADFARLLCQSLNFVLPVEVSGDERVVGLVTTLINQGSVALEDRD